MAKVALECCQAIQRWKWRCSLIAAKCILCYLKGTVNFNFALGHHSRDIFDLVSWTSSSWVQDQDNRRSTSGFVFDIAVKELRMYSNIQEIRFVSTTAFVCCWLYWPKIIASRIQDEVLRLKKKRDFLIKIFTVPLSKVRRLYIQNSYLDYP